MPANKALAATSLARDVAGFFVPGLSLVTGIATYSSAKSIDAVLVNQSGRVALGLMHDPGYDVHQAPFAWWTIASRHKKDITDTPLPPRAANLYGSIGTTWEHDPDSTPLPSTSQSAAMN